jgi:hypothetical protein
MEELIERLRNYRTRLYNRPLKYNSVCSYVAQAYREHPEYYAIQSQRATVDRIMTNEERVWSDEEFDEVRRVITVALSWVTMDDHQLDFETGVAVLLACACSLRSNEVRQITLANVHAILRNEFINIHTKKSKRYQQRIMCYRPLLERYVPVLEHKYAESVDRPMIGYSKVAINHHLRKVTNMVTPFGLQTVRKWMTTAIVKESNGDIVLAQKFNRHSNWKTTHDYYNKNERSLANELNNVFF